MRERIIVFIILLILVVSLCVRRKLMPVWLQRNEIF